MDCVVLGGIQTGQGVDLIDKAGILGDEVGVEDGSHGRVVKLCGGY